MLYTTVELIAQAYSNFHFIFCFCNVIIIFLLIGSARPSNSRSSPVHQAVKNRNALLIKESACRMSDYSDAAKEEDDDDIVKKAGPHDKDKREKLEERSKDDDDDDHDDDDGQLRRRIEEFIDKVNREWRAEKIRASSSATYPYNYD